MIGIEADRTILSMAKFQSKSVTFTLSRVNENNTDILGISRGKVVCNQVTNAPIDALTREMERQGFQLIDKQFSVE